MTKRLGWIGVLSLIFAGVSTAPLIEAQNRSSHGPGSSARVAQPQSMGHSPQPRTAAPKGEANNRGQHPGSSAPASPAGLAAAPTGATQPHPSGAVSGQIPAAPQTQSPFSDSFIAPNQGVKTPVSPSGPSVQIQPQRNGTSGTNPPNQTTSQNPATAQNQTTSQNQTQAPFSQEELTPPTGRRNPKEGTPQQPTKPNTQKPNQKPQPKVQPPPTMEYPPLGAPQPLFPLKPSPNGLLTPGHNTSYPPAALDQTQPSVTNSTSNGSPEKAPIEKEQTAPSTPQNNPTPKASAQSQGGDAGKVIEIQNLTPHPPPPPMPPIQPPVLTLSPSPSRPAVGTTVVVTAKLDPSQNQTSYKLDWGDGSPVETISKSATHRYTKTNTYKVWARTTTADGEELNREIMLPVVVWPWVTVSLASVAGVGFLSLHMLVNLTTGCRWDAPKMTFVGKQPYVSLSFVPDVGPAEERITILNKSRRSG